MKQDDPAKCTSAKLVKFHLVRKLNNPSRFPKRAIVLNPSSDIIVTPMDRIFATDSGVVAIDCSWKRAYDVFGGRRFRGQQRKLPLLLAANPVNYGSLAILSSVEAITAALYIFGEIEQAEKIISLFKWGRTFLDLNREPLEEYRKVKSLGEIVQAEKQFFPQALSNQKPL